MSEFQLPPQEKKQIRQQARRETIIGTILGCLLATVLSIGLILLFWWLGWLVGDVQTIVGTIGLWVVGSGVLYGRWWTWDQSRQASRTEELEYETIETKKRTAIENKDNEPQPILPSTQTTNGPPTNSSLTTKTKNSIELPPNDSQEQAVQKYLKEIIRLQNEVGKKNVALSGKEVTLSVHDPFLEQRDATSAREQREQEQIILQGEWCRKDGDLAEPVRDVGKRLLSIGRGFLLGEPGSGKSWTLATLMLNHAERYLNPATPAHERLIPILVPLNKFTGTTGAGKELKEQPFHEYVTQQVKAVEPSLVPYLPKLLETKRVILLCDALNEMPRRAPKPVQRDLVAEMRNTLAAWQANDTIKPYFLLSCRRRDYKDDLNDERLRPLEQIYLHDLTPRQIYTLITLRLGQVAGEGLWKEMGGSAELPDFWDQVIKDFPGDGAERFWKVNEWWGGKYGYGDHPGEKARQTMLRHLSRLVPLCRSPFLARQICYIFTQRQKASHPQPLPRNRAELFQQLVQIMVDAEQKRAQQRKERAYAHERVETALGEIATEMQKAKRTALPRDYLVNALKQRGADTLLNYALSAQLLDEDNSPNKNIKFTHQLFQEYFAAKKVLNAFESEPPQNPAPLFGKSWWETDEFAVTVVILGEMGGGKERANAVARWLAPFTPELALNVILEHGAGLTLADVEQATATALIESANAKINEPDPIGRATAYRVLGRLNADTRPGVGLFPQSTIPQMAWCHIPNEGSTPIGGDSEAYQSLPADTPTINSFWLAKYPITHQQFQPFLDDPDGYYRKDKRWWRGLAWEKPEHWEAQFPIANHPRESINWYECVAFCRWLTHRLKTMAPQRLASTDLSNEERTQWEGLQKGTLVVRLPTAQEWEKAARGKEGWQYGYQSNDYEPHRMNVGQTGIRQTSAVGIFADSPSPYGVMDMSGNVWEWGLTTFENNDNGVAGESARVLRGGSWVNVVQNVARAASRDDGRPGLRFVSFGGRAALAPPTS
jgi:formylglycine-generating enzyme required for sulfatase activity